MENKTKSKPKKRVSDLTFEEAMAKLEAINTKLETNDDLQKSIVLYKKGKALKDHAEKLLHDAEQEIAKIQRQENEGTKTTKANFKKRKKKASKA